MENKNYKKVKLVLWIILFANFAVAILKIVVGTLIRSASMTADGFHSLSDGASNIVGLVGISFASKPKDEGHPYGHKKFEMLSSMFIGGMLLVIAFNIFIDSLSRFKNPVTPNITTESLIALVITLFINIAVSYSENKIGKKLNSYILVSDSLHTRSDIFVSLGVLATLVGVKLGLPAIIDPIASVVVSGFIVYSSIEIFKSSTAVLVDQAIVNEKEIETVVLSIDKIKGIHNIRSRGSNDDIYIDMHVLVEKTLTAEECHNLSHEVEDEIKKVLNKNIEVFLHIDCL